MAGMARRFGILIVGKDPEIVGPLAEAIGLLIPEGSVIQVAHTIKDAKERLLRERYHALLADQKLPDGLGASLLRTMLALRGQGLAYFLFGQLDADDSETIRLLQDHPEVSFIERPFRPDLAAHQICAAILPSTTADQSFYGLRLVDLIQAFSLGKRNTSLLVLMPDNKMGTIFIREGQLVHATVGREEGVDALARMIGCQKGEIRVQNGCTTSKETIRRPTQHTLIEVFRRLDERKRDTLRETQEDGEKAGGVRSSMRAGEQGPPFLAPAAPSPPSPPSLSSAPSHLVSPPPIPAPPAPPSPAGMRQSETQPGELIVEDADLAIRKKVVATNDVEFMREFDSMFDSTASGPPLDALLASAAAAATLGDPGAVPAQIQNKLPSPSLPSLPPLPPLSSAPPMAPAAAREKDTETFAGARQAPAALASAPPSPARLVSSLGPELAPAAPSKPSSRILSYPAVFSASPGAEPHPPRDQVATAPSNPGDSDMGLPAPSRPMTASFRIRASASPPQEQPGLPPSPVPQSAATTLRPFLRPAIPPRPRSASDTDWSKQIPKKSVRDLLDEALKS